MRRQCPSLALGIGDATTDKWNGRADPSPSLPGRHTKIMYIAAIVAYEPALVSDPVGRTTPCILGNAAGILRRGAGSIEAAAAADAVAILRAPLVTCVDLAEPVLARISTAANGLPRARARVVDDPAAIAIAVLLARKTPGRRKRGVPIRDLALPRRTGHNVAIPPLATITVRAAGLIGPRTTRVLGGVAGPAKALVVDRAEALAGANQAGIRAGFASVSGAAISLRAAVAEDDAAALTTEARSIALVPRTLAGPRYVRAVGLVLLTGMLQRSGLASAHRAVGSRAQIRTAHVVVPTGRAVRQALTGP